MPPPAVQPAFVVLAPGRLAAPAAQLWSSAFLPAIYQGTAIANHGDISNPENLTTQCADFAERMVDIDGSRSAENHCEHVMARRQIGAAS